MDYLKLIERGIEELTPEVCNMIATAFRWGNCGLERNVSKAVHYLEFAAKSDHSKSMYELGDIYYWGIGIEKDREKAEYWYTLAAEAGYAEAQYALGYIFSQKNDLEQEIEWFWHAAKQGHLPSQVKLGSIYYFTKKEYEQAANWFEIAAEERDMDAEYYLAECYRYGNGREKNIEKAVSLYKAAFVDGNDRAAWELGKIYHYGEDAIESNVNKAIYWYKKAANSGIPYAQEILKELENI